MLARIDVGRQPTPTAISDGGGADISTQAGDPGVDAARRSRRRSPTVTRVDPAVLVRPFEADTENIAPVEIEPVDFFAPSSIALLLQHLALTFAALSLVRDRELGLLELLRVGPLSSMRDPRRQDDRLPRSSGSPSAPRWWPPRCSCSACRCRARSLWVAAVVVLVLLASLALGMVLSMISGSETQAVQFAMLSLLAGMFFSGFFLDVSQLATPYRYISYLLPVTYGINVLQDVMLRGAEPATADLDRARRARRRLRLAGRAAAAPEAAGRMTDRPIADSARTTARTRAVFNRRRIGRAVTSPRSSPP